MADNETDEFYDLTETQRGFAILVYSLIALLALGGNSIVIFLVLYFQKLKTPTNFLIANLALADLLMAILCIPFSYWPVLIMRSWPFGGLMCKVLNFSQLVAVLATSYTLVVISIDRFLAIRFPMRPHMRLTLLQVNIITAAVWMVCALLSVPELIAFRLMPKENDTEQYDCQPANWNIVEDSVGLSRANYNVFIFLMQFAIPFIVLVLTYLGIGVVIWTHRIPGEQANRGATRALNGGHAQQHGRRDTVKKMLPMMILVTFLYVICWLPQNVLMNILVDYVEAVADHPRILYIWWVCHTLAMSHSFVNPIIYCCRNEKFREGFAFVFRFLPCVSYTGTHLNEGRMVLMTKTVHMTTSVAYAPMARAVTNGNSREHVIMTAKRCKDQ